MYIEIYIDTYTYTHIFYTIFSCLALGSSELYRMKFDTV